ncbi:MAG TPA: hypothetical protein VJ890_25265 [Vineibacter sp.]|nr:hypothetical protein [Vineibacter sp.]
MDTSFAPTFRDFQKDIERHLEHAGMTGKNEHGQTVYREYDKALAQMFRAYIEKEAFAPLVVEFRRWNWEWNYGDNLMELTDCLRRSRDWPLLKNLWAAVVAKRRTNYNKTKKARKGAPDKISEALVEKTRGLLLESLGRLRGYAAELGQEADVTEYIAIIGRVERRLNA